VPGFGDAFPDVSIHVVSLFTDAADCKGGWLFDLSVELMAL
jgi:hypothetical protein